MEPRVHEKSSLERVESVKIANKRLLISGYLVEEEEGGSKEIDKECSVRQWNHRIQGRGVSEREGSSA